MEKIFFGNVDGVEVFKYTVKNGDMELSALSLGATVQSLKYKGQDVVLGYDSAKEYFDNDGYLGASIGRYTNRISGGKFTLNGKEYVLNKNDNTNTLHGGNVGFDKRNWNLISYTENSLVFEYFSPDGEENFPANLCVRAEYVLTENSLKMIYGARTDGDTPVNLTNHTYFNLNGKGNILEHELEIVADEFIPLNSEFAPYGEIRSVKDCAYDFTKIKKIGKDIDKDEAQIKIAGGFDQYFIVNGSGFRKAVTLISQASGIKMDCFTDCKGLQFYSGNFLTERKGKGGEIINYRDGLCLETHGYPNAVNCKNYPQNILKKGENYRSETEYRFSKI